MKDKSFKAWFSLMWGDGWIQVFLIASTALGLEIYYSGGILDLLSSISTEDGRSGLLFAVSGLLVPIIVIVLISYKGFYKFWKAYLNDFRG